MIFNVVFLCTLISLLVQGSSLTKMAQSLHLAVPKEPEKKLQYFDIDLPDEIQSSASEMTLQADMMLNGNSLKDIKLPLKTLVIMVRRGDDFFVPVGTSVLMEGDHLLFITDRDAKAAQKLIEEDDEFDLNQWTNEIRTRLRKRGKELKIKLDKLNKQ